MRVAATTPTTGETGVSPAAPITFAFNYDVLEASIVFTLSNGGPTVTGVLTYDAPSKTATWTPDSVLLTGREYTATVSAAETAGALGMAAPHTWAFTTTTGAVNLFGNAVPPNTDAGGYIIAGVRFKSSAPGVVAGLRFYKNASNTGTHIGTLCVVDQGTGDRLSTPGTLKFSGESGSGWQEEFFDTPVRITVDTIYQANVVMPAGFASYDAHAFDSDVVNGVLTAVAGVGVGGTGNGKFTYTVGGFPDQAFNNNNYFVDVLFFPD